jgi:hypothetical protein
VARLLGYRGAQQLYVLAPDNDPFACRRDSHRRDAEWFAGMWEDLGLGDGVHLRRIHYRLVADGDRALPDGRPYLNTEKCWSRLTLASKHARVLGLVDAEAFVDRRNRGAIRHRMPRDFDDCTPSVCFVNARWHLPEVDPSLFADVSLYLPHPFPGGYEYDVDDQPVLLELWVEKSTMRDVLEPRCRGMHMNYAEAAGFESMTHAIELLRRAEEHGKPAHILYVSDFDPAGEGMPVAVARQVQFWRETLGVEEHVSLDPIVLTRDQVDRYKLPREPVKDTDRRRAAFDERHGEEGATELDALEALHAGELAKIVREAVKPWADADLAARLATARLDAETLISRKWMTESQELRAEAERLEREGRAASAEVAPQIAALISEQLSRLEPFERRAEELRVKAQEIFERLDLDLPVRPEPEVDALADRDGLLFDSRRDWVEQLEIFKAKQRGQPSADEDSSG